MHQDLSNYVASAEVEQRKKQKNNPSLFRKIRNAAIVTVLLGTVGFGGYLGGDYYLNNMTRAPSNRTVPRVATSIPHPSNYISPQTFCGYVELYNMKLPAEEEERLKKIEQEVKEKYPTLEDYRKDPKTQRFIRDIPKTDATGKFVLSDKDLMYGLYTAQLVFFMNHLNDPLTDSRPIPLPGGTNLARAFTRLMNEDVEVRKYIEEQMQRGGSIDIYENALKHSRFYNRNAGKVPIPYREAEAAVLYNIQRKTLEAVEIAKTVSSEDRDVYLFAMLLGLQAEKKPYRACMQAEAQVMLGNKAFPDEKQEMMALHGETCMQYGEKIFGNDPIAAGMSVRIGKRYVNALLPFAEKSGGSMIMRFIGEINAREGDFSNAEKRLIEAFKRDKTSMTIITDLFALYSDWGKPKEAEKYRKMLEEYKTK